MAVARPNDSEGTSSVKEFVLRAGSSLLAVSLGFAATSNATAPRAGGHDPAGPAAKHQVELLLSEGLPFAEEMLREHGEFLPFGAVKQVDGPIRIVGVDDGRERPEAGDVLALLLDRLREGARARSYSAVAIFANVRVPRPHDGEPVLAVHVGLEHIDGYCVDAFFPYALERGALTLGTSFAGAREGLVFGSCP